MAIDGSSGAYDDDPERAGDSKPEKRRGHGGQDAAGPLNTQPGEVRSRTEYYEELRATGKPMVAADGYWELVDLLIASLTLTQAPVTADERDELRSLAEAMDLPVGSLTGLNVQG